MITTRRTTQTTTSRPATRRTRLWLLLAALLIAVTTAACSGQSGGPGSGAAREDTATNGGDQALAFSRCMRANGVANFPDPDASGRTTIDSIANNSKIDTASTAFRQALTACRALQPAGFTGTKRTGDQQSAALSFAQCIRANGVTDFPDPAPGDPLVDTTKIPSANQPGGMERLRTAMSRCSTDAQAAGVTP